MAMGQVNSDEFEAELLNLNKPKESSARVSPGIIKPLHPQSRGNGNTEVPSSLRKIISEESISGTPAKELTSTFGVSESSISAYKKGATSTASYHSPNESLASHGRDVKLKISSRAKHRVLLALKHITEEKLSHAKVRDIAGIAKDMSAVVKNMEPDNSSNGGVNQQFVFYAPRNKSEQEFEIIHVNK